MEHPIEQQRPQADFHGKLHTILTTPEELKPNSHGTSEWGREIALPMSNMGFSKTLREENFELLSQEFLTSTAKEGFCLPIYHHDHPGLIDGNQSVRRNVQELE